MPRWHGDIVSDDDEYFEDELDYYEDEFGLGDDYAGFEKIRHSRKSDDESKGNKKKHSVKHQKRLDKE